MRIYCFAGPNGSGKSTTVAKFRKYNFLQELEFVNADIISKQMFTHIEDENTRNLAAAKYAESFRQQLLQEKKDFMFETVLSTPRNLEFLKEAKKQGAEITTIYVLTRDKEINVKRVANRVSEGGHPVPENKIRERYDRCMNLLPDVIDASANVFLYDNSEDHITSIMLNKENNEALIFSDNPNQDKFLQKTIIQPLESQYNYKFAYFNTIKDNFNSINIYSENSLSELTKQIKTGSSIQITIKPIDL